MKNIIEILTSDYKTYLGTSLIGLNKKVDFYHIDFTKGETDVSKLLCVNKSGLSEEDALIILIQRRLMIEEEWIDLSNYTMNDLDRWTKLLETYYKDSIYMDDIIINDDPDKFCFDRLTISDKIVSILKNDSKIDFLEFESTMSLFRNSIIKISKSRFERLETEFYIETEEYYLLFHWYTTA